MQELGLYDMKIGNILFLDIETVPLWASYEDMDETTRTLWDKKALKITRTEEQTPQELYQRAGIYAEFGKVVCISCGFVSPDNKIRIKSFASDDEQILLNDFASLLNGSYASAEKILCAHNGKEFDFPFIARRMLINGIKLPGILQIAGKKPWEINHLDTMELWKFGDYKNYTSLALLTHVFNIPTPKDDIQGSDVYEIYWQKNDLKRIVIYCQKDVVAIIQLFRKYRNEPLFSENDIEIANT
ncbi:MAG: 3'-5' exonuclease [Salinivirgaceae bacterium]|jgi:uncharacterized protein YprB with RNaseH-like and TPR domain|nr:3'-5' exonuclease [Salinivirgaceae bacterium]